MAWTPRTATEWTDLIRANLDDRLGFSVDWDGTLEGDWTAVLGDVAATSDQGFAIAVDGIDPLTARFDALDRAVAPIVARKDAIRSRYAVEVVTATTLPSNALFRDSAAQQWRLVTPGAAVAVGEVVTIEAVETGPAALSQVAPSTLTPITAMVTPTSLTYTPGDSYTLGRVVELDSQLRRRWAASLGRPLCPTAPGIRRTLAAIPWVTAVSAVRTAPGTLAIYVAPSPVGADQEVQLAEAIFACVGADALTTGADSVTIPGVDGRDVTISYTGATTQTVTVALTLVLSTGVALADVLDAATAAVQSAFDALSVGGSLYRLAITQLLPGPTSGVIGGQILLNGVASDVTPSTSTTLLVPGAITVAT